jgi:hypothetical protein
MSTQTVTYSVPNDRHIETMLIMVLVILTGVVIFMTMVHNDSLAAKFSDFIYGDLGALWGLTTRNK